MPDIFEPVHVAFCCIFSLSRSVILSESMLLMLLHTPLKSTISQTKEDVKNKVVPKWPKSCSRQPKRKQRDPVKTCQNCTRPGHPTMLVFSKDSSPFVASLLVTIGSGERLLAYSIQWFVEVLSSWGAGA